MIKTELHYKNLIKIAKEYRESRYPMSFIGMPNCGKSHLFGLLISEDLRERAHVSIPIDLTGTNGDLKKVTQSFNKGLSMVTDIEKRLHSLNQIWEKLSDLTKQANITLLLNFGFFESINLRFLNELLGWRNLLGLRLNWIVFCTYELLNTKESKEGAFKTIFMTNITPLRPLDQRNIQMVYRTFEETFGKVDKTLKNKMVKLSGGSPGLLKSLYVCAREGDLDKWVLNEQVVFRIKDILSSFSSRELSCLLAVSKGKIGEHDKQTFENLKFYGVVNKKDEIFSPIVDEYLPIFYDEAGINLSSTQREVFKLLKDKYPSVASREEIAKTIWGNKWNQRYSDWALDQMVYAIRERLKSSESKWQFLTKKNKGYFLKKVK